MRWWRIFADIPKVFFVLHAGFAITGVHHGTGQHAWDIQPPTELPIGLKVPCLSTPSGEKDMLISVELVALRAGLRAL